MRTLESWMWSWKKFQECFGTGCMLVIPVKTTTWKALITWKHCHRRRCALGSYSETDYTSRSITLLLKHHHLLWSFFQCQLAKGTSLPHPAWPNCASSVLLRKCGLGVWKTYLKSNAQEAWIFPKRRWRADLVMMWRPTQGERVQEWPAR